MDPNSEMLASVARMFLRTEPWTGVREIDPGVAQAMARVPRDHFVPAEVASLAYENQALPIACGQTISQPYIVALMTTLLRIGPASVVLEVGTGSGYQAAILAEIVARLYSIEVVPELAAAARTRLAALGYGNVTIAVGDGSVGWPEHAPFAGILVTACAESVPATLIEQLAPDGRMVIPVGPADGAQRLLLVEKDRAGEVHERPVLDVRFVPLT